MGEEVHLIILNKAHSFYEQTNEIFSERDQENINEVVDEETVDNEIDDESFNADVGDINEQIIDIDDFDIYGSKNFLSPLKLL